MNTQEALQVLKPEAATLEALKQAYRAAARKYHPDVNPHGEELMKLVNAAYDLLVSSLGEWAIHENAAEGPSEMSLDEEMSGILSKIGHLPGLLFEICGTWLWVTGNTYLHRQALKDAGLFFAPKKKAWFWRPPESKTSSRGQWDLDKIRNVHGSRTIKTQSLQGLNA